MMLELASHIFECYSTMRWPDYKQCLQRLDKPYLIAIFIFTVPLYERAQRLYCTRRARANPIVILHVLFASTVEVLGIISIRIV